MVAPYAGTAIGCERGHGAHDVLPVDIALGGPTPYDDYPPVPPRLARRFRLWLFDWRRHHRDPGPYCPAAGIHSETIAQQGIWEPPETIAALLAMDGHPGDLMVDLGCSIGWYTALAASSGLRVLAWDGDPEQVRLLEMSADDNGWGSDQVRTVTSRIGPATPPLAAQPIRLAKLDLEGDERWGIWLLRDCIAAGMVDHLLVEVSPVFGDYYPDMIRGLMRQGFEAYLIPDKRRPPYPLADLGRDLAELDLAQVAAWEQRSVWLRRRGAAW